MCKNKGYNEKNIIFNEITEYLAQKKDFHNRFAYSISNSA